MHPKPYPAFAGTEPAERAKLELAARRGTAQDVQEEEKRYQITKDLSDNHDDRLQHVGSHHGAADADSPIDEGARLQRRRCRFFSTNDSVLTALKASFTGLFGLHESTAALETMKEGMSKSIEILADVGGKVQEAAVRSGYGPTIRADAVKHLVDSVINFQEKSLGIVAEMRDMATKNSAEIRDAVEAGNQRIARLVTEGNALGVDG